MSKLGMEWVSKTPPILEESIDLIFKKRCEGQHLIPPSIHNQFICLCFKGGRCEAQDLIPPSILDTFIYLIYKKEEGLGFIKTPLLYYVYAYACVRGVKNGI